MSNAYDKGDVIRMSVAFTVSGTPTDPTAVTLKVKDPAGTQTSYTYAGAQIVKDSTGNYHYDLDLAAATSGIWNYRFEGTGAAQASAENTFEVKRTVF